MVVLPEFRGKVGSERLTRKVLIVDLNNFARFPTVAIGYLAAVCRADGIQVSVFSPLSIGLSGVTREKRPPWYGLFAARLNYRAATTSNRFIRSARQKLASRRRSELSAGLVPLLRAFKARLIDRPDAVLISAYLMYRDHVVEMCRQCKEVGIPVIIGGPYFAQSDVAKEWATIDGATAVASGEIELELPDILRSVWRGESLSKASGLWTSAGGGKLRGTRREPLQSLNAVPFPDYSDFVWENYPNRIAPIVTGRGCGWGVCRFCSDVTSTAGRTFRSRTPQNVLDEIRRHFEQYGVQLFAFTDLKLNSDIGVWHAIIERILEAAPGCRWIGAVHVDAEGRHRPANGLTEEELKRASESGCVRLTTGLESGSQRVLNEMKKGSKLEVTSQFLERAARSQISVRCTVIVGYPGESTHDARETAHFLKRHYGHVERVSLNRFQIITGTSIHRALEKRPSIFDGIKVLTDNPSMAEVTHQDTSHHRRGYRRAVFGILKQVHRINRKAVLSRASEFEGVM